MFVTVPKGDQNTVYDLYSIMKKELGKPAIDPETGRDVGARNFPVSSLSVPVDAATGKSNKTVNPEDSVVSPMVFEIPQSKLDGGLIRSDLMVLNIIAANKWKRPIYFTSPYGDLVLDNISVKMDYPIALFLLKQNTRRLTGCWTKHFVKCN